MTSTPDRRTVLKGAGAAAVVAGSGALTACGGQPGGQASPTPSSSAPPAKVHKADVPVGGGVVLDQRFVVTQPEAGTFKAFGKTCPHAGCAVSFIKAQRIVCACHGSEFSIADGARTAGPAKQGLTPAPVQADGDDLTVG